MEHRNGRPTDIHLLLHKIEYFQNLGFPRRWDSVEMDAPILIDLVLL